jgi:hypothetical protein
MPYIAGPRRRLRDVSGSVCHRLRKSRLWLLDRCGELPVSIAALVLHAAADFVVAPDVTSFDMSEFTRADEMALIGETATNATIEKLRTMLSKLDPKLFESSWVRPISRSVAQRRA